MNLPSWLQVCGLAAIVGAAAAVSLVLAAFLFGVFLLIFGIALERR